MVPLYSYLTYRGTVLGPTDVQQRKTKVMDRRKHSQTMTVDVLCEVFIYFSFTWYAK